MCTTARASNERLRLSGVGVLEWREPGKVVLRVPFDAEWRILSREFSPHPKVPSHLILAAF
jgi:hypothetical protein